MNPLLFKQFFFKVAFLAIPFAMAAIAYSVCTILRVPDDLKFRVTLITLVAVLLIVLIVMLFKWLRKRSKAGKLEEGLAAAGRAERKGEIDALRKGWKESVAKLRGTAVAGGGGRALAALPWFVIIGAPASGKSTLLRQSGIDFPVGDAAVRGLQGTRNCDWWFSNVGIFLDTAGRYISDESAEEWGQFLDLVRRHRAGSPINGVIVALPSTDLFDKGYDEQDLEARRIRARLDELIDHLGVNFPVWIVVTKVDLVGGFAEFFGRADAVVRQQMMGWTLDQGEGARFDPSDFERKFQAMIHRLREIRPSMVGAADLRDRPAAFAFPDELAAAAEPLQRMLARIFEPNVYQETPLIRGVYITSATQMGTPLQRAAARVRELLGAPAVDADARGALIKNAYFVKDLMHERIVLDQNMTWTTEREVDRGKTKRLGINLMGASVGVLFFLTVLAFGFQASKELKKVEDNVNEVTADRGGAVTKADGLWNAQRQSNADNLRNLGLSQQGSLLADLTERQKEVYREDVLTPLVVGFRTDIEAADISAGLAPLGVLYAQFRDVEEALQRAADPTTKPEKLDEEDEDPDPAAGKTDPAAVAAAKAKALAVLAGKEEPDPDHAPPGFFTKKQRKTFDDRQDRFRAQKILGKKKKDERPTVLLLDVIWRNKGGIDDVRAEIKAVHDAYAARVRQYVAAASAAVKAIEGDDVQRARYVSSRRDGFIAACKQIRASLEAGSVEPGDLADALAKLSDAATGAATLIVGSTSDPKQDALIRSIPESIVLVEASGVSPASLEGLEILRQWNSKGTTATGKTDTDAAQRAALNAVAGELRKLGEAAAASDLVSRPWPGERATTIRDAVGAINTEVNVREKQWLTDVQPHLATIAGVDLKTYQGDPTRWGLAVELIDPTMRRNVLYAYFLQEQRSGTFKWLAQWQIVKNRKAENDFSRNALTTDLSNLLGAVAFADTDDPRRLTALSSKETAGRLVQSNFKTIVDLAQEYWDARCRAIPRYPGGDPWAYIGRWTDPDGAVAKIALTLRAGWPTWVLDPGLRAPGIEQAAQDAWALVEVLRKRYEPFTTRYTDLATILSTLAARGAWQPPAALDRVAQELGGATDRAVWDPRPILDAIGTDVVDTTTRNDLINAVRDAEREVLRRIEMYFDGKWDAVRGDLQAASRDADKPRLAAGMKAFEALSSELMVMFGQNLSNEPGARLRVSSDYRTARDTLKSATRFQKAVTKGFTVTFTCKRVPYRANDDQGVRLPHIEMEYKESTGGDGQRKTWKTSGTEPLTVTWSPAKGAAFTLRMWNEAHDRSSVFREWREPTCLIDAIRDGGGATPTLTWDGNGEFSGSKAVFDMNCSDPSMLMQQLSTEAPEPGAELRPDCIEILERR